MTKQSTHKISLLAGLITGLLALNCSAETTRASNASSNLGYKSSLSGFKSINDNADKLTANDSLEEIKSRDHSKMSAEEMNNMDHSKMDHSKMDHSKMSADEMKDMPGMDHSKMSADEMKDMKAAPAAASKPAKVKKSKPSKKLSKPVLPAKANPHQNHQM